MQLRYLQSGTVFGTTAWLRRPNHGRRLDIICNDKADSARDIEFDAACLTVKWRSISVTRLVKVVSRTEIDLPGTGRSSSKDYSCVVAQGGLNDPPWQECWLSGVGFDSQPVVDGNTELLFASEVALRR